MPSSVSSHGSKSSKSSKASKSSNEPMRDAAETGVPVSAGASAAPGATAPTTAAPAAKADASRAAVATGATRTPTPTRPGGASKKTAKAVSRPSPNRRKMTPRKPAGGGGVRGGVAAVVTPKVVEEKPATFKGTQPHTYKRVLRYNQPGPGEYQPPGGIGKQPDSRYRTMPAAGFGVGERLKPPASATARADFLRAVPPSSAPKFSFGSAPRDQYEALYMDKGTARSLISRTTKDIGFMEVEKAACIGKPSPVSTRPTSPRFSFGSTPRMKFTHQQKITAGVDFLPPSTGNIRSPRAPTWKFGSTPRYQYQAYQPTRNATTLDDKRSTSLGAMVDSRKRSMPSWSFGSGPRTRYPTATTDVEYMPQHLNSVAGGSSTRPAAPRHTFGTANRDTVGKTGILPAHTTRSAALPGKV